MHNFFSKLYSKKRSATSKPFSPDLSLLFDFLTNEVTVPRQAANIIKLAKQSSNKDSEELLSIYLLLESHLCNIDPERKYTRELLRDTVACKFPKLPLVIISLFCF